MARSFNGTSDVVSTTVGGLSAFAWGTLVAVCRRNANNVWHSVISLAPSGLSARIGLEISSSNEIDYGIGGGGGSQRSPTIRVNTTDGWVLISVSKASGSANARFHKGVLSTGVWSHEDGTAPIADATAPGGTAVAQFGKWGSSTDWFNGDIAMVAAYASVLSDTQIESMGASLQAWFAPTPAALWVFDQQSTGQAVIDLTGGGANQSAITGTNISAASVPILSYGHPVIATRSSADVGPYFRVGSNATGLGSAGTCSVTIPLAVQVDDYMVMTATFKIATGTDTIQTPSGWTQLVAPTNGSGGQFQTAVFSKVAVSGDRGASVTVAGGIPSSQQINAVFAAYANADTTPRSATLASNGATDSTSVSAASATTSSGDLVIYVGGARENANGPASQPTFTGPGVLRVQSAGTSGGAQNVAVFLGDDGGSSASRTITASQSSWSIAGQIILKAPGGGAGTKNGAASLAATGTLTVAGTTTLSGAASLSATSSLTAAATTTQFPAAILSATSTLTAAATRAVPGAADLSATSALTVDALPTRQAAADLSAVGTLTAAATATTGAAATLSGTSDLTVAATATAVAAADLSGTATLTATASTASDASTSLSGTSTLAVAADETAVASAALSATSTLAATAVATTAAAATLSATSTLNAAATRSLQADAALAATSTLTIAAAGTASTAAALSATSTLTAAATVTTAAAAALDGAGVLTVDADAAPAGGASLTGTSALAVAAVTATGASAALTGTSGLTVAAIPSRAATAALSGQSALTADATQTLFALVTMTASGTLTAVALGGGDAAANLNGTSSLTVAGITVRVTAANLAGTGTVTVSATATGSGTSASLSALSSLVATAFTAMAANAALSARSDLTVTMTGGTEAVRRPGAFTAGTTRPTLTAGTLRSRLMAGTSRGPTYLSGG